MDAQLQSCRRVLIIDDNQAIHDDFKKILLAPDDTLSISRSELFGVTTTSPETNRFMVHSAFQGQEGLERVRESSAAGEPYAMAFVDVRMPPGWDGIETVARIWNVDPDIQIVICTAYSDYSRDEMIAHLGHADHWLILKKPFDNIEVLQLANALTEKWFLLQAAKRKMQDLEQAVAERTRDLEAANKSAISMMQQAVDARRRAERATADLHREMSERKQLEEHLRQAQKLQAIGQLAGGIAHDFNNILGCIYGYTEMAMADAGENSAVKKNLEEVFKAAKRAKALVLQILAFSRQQEQEHKPIKLEPIIEETLRLLRASIPATISITFDVKDPVPAILGDKTQIHQVVMNLATNAAHAMRGQPGELMVKVEAVEVGDDVASSCPDLEVGKYVRLAVSDTGCGIDPATLERIFEPFFTTKGPGEGTGLGLSVVHGIVKAHAGAITVRSEPGRGTSFKLYFPAVADKAAETQHFKGTTLSGSGERILLVDDEDSLAFFARKSLERAGYNVTVRTDPQAALETFREHPDDFDLVVSDLKMPHLTGLELIGELLKTRPDLPVILTTGFCDPMTVERAGSLGISELLMKPATSDALTEAAHRVLNQNRKAAA